MYELNNTDIGFLTQLNSGELEMPYEMDIFLLDSIVAGTSHVEGIFDIPIAVGDRLKLIREPENPFDDLAVRIETMASEKIGYIPRKDNAVFARLLDAGKILYGTISSMETKGMYLRLGLKLWMHEI